MYRNIKADIVRKEMLAQDICRITAYSPWVCKNSRPGQFLNVRCSEGTDPILRRPVSICDASIGKNEFDIIFMIKGKGTRLLVDKNRGEELDVLGPLGNSFDTSESYKKIVVVGGGIGIYPLLFLLKYSGAESKTCCLGFRNSEAAVMTNEFRGCTDTFIITTDDGSIGSKGFVTERLDEVIKSGKPDIMYACGPNQMLRAVSSFAAREAIPCQVSMEQRMACGIGACLVCACKTKNPDNDDWDYSHVCKDGPVFWSHRISFED